MTVTDVARRQCAIQPICISIQVRRFFGRRNKMTSTFVESDFICYAVLLHSVPGERRIKVYSNQIFSFHKKSVGSKSKIKGTSHRTIISNKPCSIIFRRNSCRHCHRCRCRRSHSTTRCTHRRSSPCTESKNSVGNTDIDGVEYYTFRDDTTSITIVVVRARRFILKL